MLTKIFSNSTQAVIGLFFCALLIFVPLTAQESEPATLEPATLEPATLEPATLEPATLEPATLEPATLEPATLEPATLEPTITNLITEQAVTPEITASSTPTLEIQISPTFTPTALFTSSFLATTAPTPGVPAYTLRERPEQNNLNARSSGECVTYIDENYAVIGLPSGLPHYDFYDAVNEANSVSRITPYEIYLCPGTHPLTQTVVLFQPINIYGQGIGVSIVTQADHLVMGGIFTLNGNRLELHNLTVNMGYAMGIANRGAVVRTWSGSLGIYDSHFTSNQAEFGGVFFGGNDNTIARSYFESNLGVFGGGVGEISDIDINCARFVSNNVWSGQGGVIYLSEDGFVSYSSFVNNSATPSAADIYDSDSGSVTMAQNNWWGGTATPQVPDQISLGVDVSFELGFDPTGLYEDGDYYNPLLGDCQMHTPRPMPELPDYAIMFVDDGSADWWFEESQVRAGVSKIGDAFNLLSSVADTPIEAFNNVYATGLTTAPPIVLFVRSDSYTNTVGGSEPDIEVSFTYDNVLHTVIYDDINNGNCKAFPAGIYGVVVRPRAVVCNGNFTVTEYTTVHELGHIFDYKIGRALENTLNAGTYVLTSCISTTGYATPVPYTVMGQFFGDFRRGNRGWGSGSYLSDFQQSPESTGLEAAADMFLNWVYRVTAGPTGDSPLTAVAAIGIPPGAGCMPIPDQYTVTPTPENWQGFLNRDWVPNPSIYDWGWPGHVRYTWMHSQMVNIFSANPSW